MSSKILTQSIREEMLEELIEKTIRIKDWCDEPEINRLFGGKQRIHIESIPYFCYIECDCYPNDCEDCSRWEDWKKKTKFFHKYEKENKKLELGAER